MNAASLFNGTLFISADTIAKLARKHGLDLDLEIRSDALTASLSAPIGPMHVPVKVILTGISASKSIIEGDGLSIHASMLPVPMSLLKLFTGKYKFLAIDSKNAKVFINLGALLPGDIEIDIEGAKLVDHGIEILIKSLIINDLNNIL